MKSKLRFLRFGALLWLSATFVYDAAAKDIYNFNQDHSTISFRVRQFLGGTNGKFKQFSGKIDLDREHPEQSSVTAAIAVHSIDTRNKKRDDHLRSEEFFNAAKYPEIIFGSRSARQGGPQSGDIFGDLTMHGVTKPVTLHVKLLTPLKEGPALQQTRWEITAEPIRRRDFGLVFTKTAEAVSGISNEVAIKMEIEATLAQ